MKKYDHNSIEKKWQSTWDDMNLYNTADNVDGKENFYILSEFSYPSGNLHVGHWYAFALPDIFARFQRMNGKNVLYPMGFDAFGLPAENAAIKHRVNPKKWTYDNIEYMTKQLRSMGASFDWSRKVITCDPQYYKWTQWQFLQFLEHGLVEQKEVNVNWCPGCKTVLANEQVHNGSCERCVSSVVQKALTQWVLKITKYADRLIDDLDNLDWPSEIKQSQKNWIGRSFGSKLSFELFYFDEHTLSTEIHANSEIFESSEIYTNVDMRASIEVFTTRPDTLFGVTYLVLAPEHKLVDILLPQIKNAHVVTTYRNETISKTALERQQNSKTKSGICLEGIECIHPLTKEKLPVWIADYVVADYGTGAVMAVPAHDERDYEFAQKHNLPSRRVIESSQDLPCADYGVLVDSEEFSGQSSHEVKKAITEKAGGSQETLYTLRDWTVSRQRYWGAPIPIIHCPSCGAIPVPEKSLPVELPDLEEFLPTDDGQSPLSRASDWLFVSCPKCKGEAKRESDTLDTFVDSSWYFLRYLDPRNDKEFCSIDNQKKWMPLNFYSGGAEQTTMHLLYSRFWNKALFDMGLTTQSEYCTLRMNRGLILGTDGNKMSKSKGNVIDPDDIVMRLGADTVRMYLAFIGPFNETGSYPWDANGVVGIRRFLERVFYASEKVSDSVMAQNKILHESIKKVTTDIAILKYNTAISQLMIHSNSWATCENISRQEYMIFLQLLAPFAPHLAEELWSKNEGQNSVHQSNWPKFDEQYLVVNSVTLGVQVNGRLRGSIEISPDAHEEDALSKARENKKIAEYITNVSVQKIIYIPGKILNIVTL